MTTQAGEVAVIRHPDEPIVTWTVDDRRHFLKEMAENVGYEQGRPLMQQPYTRAMKELLPKIAAVGCGEPFVVFDRLVDAVVALRGFNQHPRWDREADDAQQKVQGLLSQLLGGAVDGDVA